MRWFEKKPAPKSTTKQEVPLTEYALAYVRQWLGSQQSDLTSHHG